MAKNGLVKRLGRLALAGIMTIASSGTALAMRNPAAVYCQEMGYEYKVETSGSGEQKGVCVVDGKEYSDWAFFQGEVGKEHSFCERKGYDTVTRTDGRNKFSPKYAVCAKRIGKEILESRKSNGNTK